MSPHIHRPEVESKYFAYGDWRHRALCPTCGPLGDWGRRVQPARDQVEEHKEYLRSQVPAGHHCVWEAIHNRRPWEVCHTCAEGRRTGRLTA